MCLFEQLSLLNRLWAAIPARERLITCEEVCELGSRSLTSDGRIGGELHGRRRIRRTQTQRPGSSILPGASMVFSGGSPVGYSVGSTSSYPSAHGGPGSCTVTGSGPACSWTR